MNNRRRRRILQQDMVSRLWDVPANSVLRVWSYRIYIRILWWHFNHRQHWRIYRFFRWICQKFVFNNVYNTCSLQKIIKLINDKIERVETTEECLELLECRLELMFAKGSFESPHEESDEDETFTPSNNPMLTLSDEG